MKQLSRVKWSIGQTLLPEHMRALEDSVLSDSATRGIEYGLPYFGYSSVQFGSALQTDGLLTIERGVIVTRSGRLLSIGDNATINTINLNNTGINSATIYLHVIEPVFDDDTNPNERLAVQQIIPSWKWQLQLSLDDNIGGTIEYLKLGSLVKNINSQWSFSADYIPPLLQVSSVGHLQGEVAMLKEVCDKYLRALLEECAGLQISGENLIAVRRCILEVRVFRQFLSNLMAQIHVHPYVFYEKLMKFYLEVCNYQGSEPVYYGISYDHNDLAGTLLKLLNGTLSLFQRVQKVKPMIEFVRNDGVQLAELTDSCIEAEKWFILIQRQGVQEEHLDIDRIKFSAESRLPLVHKFFLHGLQVNQVDRPVFQHYFGPDVDVYEIEPGEEWNLVLSERKLGFLDELRFASKRFFLYWSVS